jgi:FkbM family methyltransferase
VRRKLRRLHLVWNLGRNFPARLIVLALFALFTARTWLGLGRSRPHRVRLRLGEQAIDWWVADRGDLQLLASVFLDGEYDGPLPARADLIVDLGAHVGATVVFWRQRYPGAEIVAVEPDPESFSRLNRHVGDDPGVQLLQAAVVERSGPVRFVGSGSSWASHLAREGEDDAIEVQGLSFPDLLAQAAPGRRIDLLKVDIEGAEPSVLASPLSSISTLVVETHDSSGEPAEDPTLETVASREGMRMVRTRMQAVNWLVRD